MKAPANRASLSAPPHFHRFSERRMTHALQQTFSIGETVAVEFKRCGNGIPPDTYETVCAFLNRFGGDIYFGVLDDGSGVRKLFKYSRPFAGSEPTLTEGDVFQTSLSLDADWFAADAPANDGTNINVPINVLINVPINVPIKSRLLDLVHQRPGLNREQLAQLLAVDVKTIARALTELAGLVEHRGSKKTGGYHLVPSSSNPADLNSADKLPPREDFP